MELRLDYAIPRFRDYRMGRFLYRSKSEFFADKEITKVSASARTRQHARYLEKIGFAEAGSGRYELSLA